MGGNYERGMYRQLQELMKDLDNLRSEFRVEREGYEHQIKELREEMASERKGYEQRISELEGELSEVKAENELLKRDNERMKRELNNNSGNSSLPPSSDLPGKAPNTYNARAKSSRAKGGQKGHKGKSLTKADVDRMLASGKYSHKVITHGKESKEWKTRYTLDIEIKPVIIEHRFYADENGKYAIPKDMHSEVTYGKELKTIAVLLYSEGVVSNDRIQAFLNSISHGLFNISEGSVYGFCRQFAAKVQHIVAGYADELLNSNTLYTDATTMTRNGKQSYIRSISTDKCVLYQPMDGKSISELKTLEVLKDYTGTLIHDHETAMYHFGTEHGECNVHLLRYLKKNTEESGNHWSEELARFLCDANRQKKQRLQNERYFSEDEQKAFSQAYDAIVEKGRMENKAVTKRIAHTYEKALLNRLVSYKRYHLLFLHREDVSFDNNESERNLRKCKNRQKMSGGFREKSGMLMYCTLLSFFETVKKNMGNPYQAAYSAWG